MPPRPNLTVTSNRSLSGTWRLRIPAMVQFDYFQIGRLHGTSGVAWQYTAIDVASSYTWAEIWITPKNPSLRWTSVLAQRVAAELAEHGCNWGASRPVAAANSSRTSSATPSPDLAATT